MTMTDEHNIINSFRLVKNDIMKIQEEFIELSQIQAEMLKRLGKMDTIDVKLEQEVKNAAKNKPVTTTKIITKTVTKTPKKRYLASTESDKFHDIHCPFAQNIKPKTKIIFKSKDTALNKGYKPCKCVK